MPEQCGHTGGRGESFHSRNHFCCCGGGGAVGARSASVVRRWTSASLSTGCPHGPQDADRSAGRVHGFTAWRGVRSLRLRLNRRRGARAGHTPPGPWPVQLRYETGLTGEQYVTARAWREARLERCPNHPRGGCSLARHGTYERKTPYRSLVLPADPHDLQPAARLSGGPAAGHAGCAGSKNELRRDAIELPGAMRWVRRRMRLVDNALARVIGLIPDRLRPAEIGAVRIDSENALTELRGLVRSCGCCRRPWASIPIVSAQRIATAGSNTRWGLILRRAVRSVSAHRGECAIGKERRMNDRSLQTLNRSLWAWIEGEYHNTPHRGIEGRTPLEQWALASAGVRYPDAVMPSTSTTPSSSKPGAASTRTAPSACTAASTRPTPSSSGKTSSCATTPGRRPAGPSTWSLRYDGKPAGKATRLDAYANTAVKRGYPSGRIEPGDPAPEPPPSPLAMRKFKKEDE